MLFPTPSTATLTVTFLCASQPYWSTRAADTITRTLEAARLWPVPHNARHALGKQRDIDPRGRAPSRRAPSSPNYPPISLRGPCPYRRRLQRHATPPSATSAHYWATRSRTGADAAPAPRSCICERSRVPPPPPPADANNNQARERSFPLRAVHQPASRHALHD